MKKACLILSFLLVSTLSTSIVWAEDAPAGPLTIEAASVMAQSGGTQETEASQAADAVSRCSTDKSDKAGLPWTFEQTIEGLVEGGGETCFCSGSCRFGICLWGSCSGSFLCCISCHQNGCASIGCGPVISQATAR